MSKQRKAIFLMGPTAAGKTDAAILLHQKYTSDIISVDSALVYRDMDIGTAKPDQATLQQTPHALIDICDPWQPYSASCFCNDAKKLMQDSIDHQRIPVLVGGTMLYYRSLQTGLTDLPEADQDIRAKIQNLAKTTSWQHVHQLLAKVDPVAAQRIHPNDPQRIGRAYEVYLISGKSISEYYQQDQGQSLDYQTLKIIISPADRSILHDRIAQRFKQMLQNGFVDEVETLKKDQRIHAELPAMRSVGYRQAWQYLDGEIDKETFIYKGIVATRQLAKRQLTWLRKEPDAHWVDPTQKDYLISLQNHIEAFLQ